MNVRHDRIERAQGLMRTHGLAAIVVLNHDDYRYFFGTDRSQPRAIIPFAGPATLVAFAAEEPELRAAVGDGDVSIFTHVGGQIHDVVTRLREIAAREDAPQVDGKMRVGIQMWFETPAFLVDLFRSVNPQMEVVSSDPVMDELRMVKDTDEIALMTEAQRIAGLGMDVVRGMLRPGITAHELATEALHAMMRAGAEKTSTPIHVNVGVESCQIHGRQSPKPVEQGDLVVVDLTPQVEGYCSNLARTFVLGEPSAWQRRLLEAYVELREPVRLAMRPGATTRTLDAAAKDVCDRLGLGEYRIDGIGHGLGLRFEETPASTIVVAHRNVPLREGMVMTIGHTILAIPGSGGVRFEDPYRVTADGGAILHPYPIEPVVPG